jgi:hypothetical protein
MNLNSLILEYLQDIPGASSRGIEDAHDKITRAVGSSHTDLISSLRNLYEAIDSCVDLTPEVLQQAQKALSLAKGE